MTGRASFASAEPAYSLPAFDRLAPAPSPALVAARIELHTRSRRRRRRPVRPRRLGRPGRGGPPAPRDLARSRARSPGCSRRSSCGRRTSATSTPRSRAWPPRRAAIRASRSRSATCSRRTARPAPGRSSSTTSSGRSRTPTATRSTRRARSPGTIAARSAATSAAARSSDRARSTTTTWPAPPPTSGPRRCGRCCAADFRTSPAPPTLPDELLDLHTPRQLVGLGAILERIEGDLRAAPVLAALRLTLLHAILPASRLATHPGRAAALARRRRARPAADRRRNGASATRGWPSRTRSARVRGFIQRLDGGSLGPVQARLGEDLRSLGEGTATAVLGLSGPSGLLSIRDDSSGYGRTAPTPRVRLVLGQPPMRPSLERLAAALSRHRLGARPRRGRAAADRRAGELLAAGPMELAGRLDRPGARGGRAGDGPRRPRGPARGRRRGGGRGRGDGRRDRRLPRSSAPGWPIPDDDAAGIVELLPPGGLMPPGPRTRGNVGLEPTPGGAGDPDVIPGRGLFAPPERFDQRPFSAADTARTVTETTVEILRARGEPARYERVLGEVLVGLDRAGQLRRLAAATLPAEPIPDDDGRGSRATAGAGPDADHPRPIACRAGTTRISPAAAMPTAIQPGRPAPRRPAPRSPDLPRRRPEPGPGRRACWP